jgi:hypothetical protein
MKFLALWSLVAKSFKFLLIPNLFVIFISDLYFSFVYFNYFYFKATLNTKMSLSMTELKLRLNNIIKSKIL